VKINICGYDAVEKGLHAGGVGRLVCHVTGEPLHNAEQAVCEGSFFASTHHKTASIIYEKDIEVLRYLAEKREIRNAGFEVIILGRILNREVLKILCELEMPLLVTENVKDILKMTADAVMYSELRRSPVAVYIPVRLLRCRKAVDFDGRYYCDDMDDIGPGERRARTAALEKRYNRIYDVSHSRIDTIDKKDHRNEDAQGGKILILAISGCAGMINEAASMYRNVYMCKLDILFADMTGSLAKVFRHFIIVGYATAYIKKMLMQKGIIPATAKCLELSGDKLHEIYEIHMALIELLHEQCRENPHDCAFNKVPDSVDTIGQDSRPAQIPKLPEELITNMMCTECPYRSAIRSVLRQSPGTSVYEDIYCRKRGTMVHSGISCAPSAYAAGLVITNRQGISTDVSNVRYICIECMK